MKSSHRLTICLAIASNCHKYETIRLNSQYSYRNKRVLCESGACFLQRTNTIRHALTIVLEFVRLASNFDSSALKSAFCVFLHSLYRSGSGRILSGLVYLISWICNFSTIFSSDHAERKEKIILNGTWFFKNGGVDASHIKKYSFQQQENTSHASYEFN